MIIFRACHHQTFDCPVGVRVIEQRATILSATVRSPIVNFLSVSRAYNIMVPPINGKNTYDQISRYDIGQINISTNDSDNADFALNNSSYNGTVRPLIEYANE